MDTTDHQDLLRVDSKKARDSSSALIDLLKDTAEPFLDSLTPLEGVARDIPIVGIGVSIARVAKAFRGRRFQQKLFAFIDEVRTKDIDDSKKAQFVERLTNPCEREKILTEVVESLNRLRDISKSRIYANLFISFVLGRITWERLVVLTECLESLNSSCIMNFLKFDIQGHFLRSEDDVDEIHEAFFISAGIANEVVQGHIQLNEFGLDLLRYGFLKSTEHHAILEILLELDSKHDGHEDDECPEITENEFSSISNNLKALFSRLPSQERTPYEHACFDCQETDRILRAAYG